MKLKSELYKEEQIEIINKIIDIIELNDNKITLYELDNNKDKQKQIINLIPVIREYFSFNNIKAVAEPEKIKRPWLSIIKQITKNKYNISRKDYRIIVNNNKIRTIQYTFTVK